MVEGTFPVGTYLVTVHQPISSDDGDLAKALYGSFLPIPKKSLFDLPEDKEYEAAKQPGAVVTVKGKVVLNEGRKRISLKVVSKGDRPIQVCLLVGCRVKLIGADRIALPLHRDESSTRLRSREGVRISSGHRCWNFRPIRAGRCKDGHIG